MSDPYDYGWPTDPSDDAHRQQQDTSTWRRRLREQGRELRELRKALAAAEAAAESSPPTPEHPEPAEPAEQATTLAEQLVEAQQAAVEAQEAYEVETRKPAGVTPEQIRAAQLVEAQADSALSPPAGLEGLLSRMQDRSVPYPQLLAEMKMWGFKDAKDPKQ
jgi:hypothetical protein